ncbi:MAG: DUF998 domain-containing protein [Pseudomonadota bacterium]
MAIALLVASVGTPAWLARGKPGYSALHHSISELGEIGSPIGTLTNAYFAALGVAAWWLLWSLAEANRELPVEALWMMSGIGFGYVGAALFPCDVGAPLSGTWRNTAHNAFGAVQYVGGAVGLFTLSDAASGLGQTVFAWLAGAVAVGATGISLLTAYRGLLQRVAELALFVGLVVLAWSP